MIGYELNVESFTQQEVFIEFMNTIFRFNICEPRVRRMARADRRGIAIPYVFVIYLDKR